MLFNSWQFIVVFLPVVFFGYFWLNQYRLIVAGKVWLVVTSLVFYSYFDVKYLPLILGSIFFNFAIGTGLSQAHYYRRDIGGSHHSVNKKIVLVIGVAANLLLLGYFKYADFFLENINSLAGSHYELPHIALPLAISFFTFTQIVYLVDSYRGETVEYDLLNYSLFVTFFPHLIAGPIVHHSHIMPQFASKRTLFKRSGNILTGLFIFAVGLSKKVIVADTFAVFASAGFDGGHTLSFFSAWAVSLSYTLQLYFDFSGYCDMAIGASLLFNIWLPINFNSPYKALDIQDFWRRWHITLSSFLRDYLYVPLGGSRCAQYRVYINLFITFVLGGLWHGATWMFVIWGALHGVALIVHRIWKSFCYPLPRAFAWALTFLFVNFAWIFFRAKTIDDAFRIIHGMVDIKSITGQQSATMLVSEFAWGGWLSDALLSFLPAGLVGQTPIYLAILLALLLLKQKNSMEISVGTLGWSKVALGALLFSVSMYFMLAATSSVFLYFNF